MRPNASKASKIWCRTSWLMSLHAEAASHTHTYSSLFALAAESIAKAKQDPFEINPQYLSVSAKLGEGEFCDVFKGSLLVCENSRSTDHI